MYRSVGRYLVTTLSNIHQLFQAFFLKKPIYIHFSLRLSFSLF